MPKQATPMLGSLLPLNDMLIRYHREVRNARRDGRPVAWVSLGFPVEFLHAMGIVPVYPQLASAIWGQRGRVKRLFDLAEGIGGYSANLCSEMRGSLGIMLAGEDERLRLPEPDFVLACSNVCSTALSFFKSMKSHFGVKGYFIDTPLGREGLTEPGIRYVKRQLVDCFLFLEEATGTKLSSAVLRRTGIRSMEAYKLWVEVHDLCRNVPSPLNALEAFIHMFPITVLRGREETTKYYRILKREIEDRVAKGIGAVPDERVRLLWDFLPIYHKTRFLSGLLARNKACVVVGSYFYPEMLDFYEEFRMGILEEIEEAYEESTISEHARHLCFDIISYGFAKEYTSIQVNQGIEEKAETLARLIREFKVDGFILHAVLSCRPLTLPQFEILRLVEERTGVPGIMIEADSMDPSGFSDGQVTTRLEAFIERLGT